MRLLLVVSCLPVVLLAAPQQAWGQAAAAYASAAALQDRGMYDLAAAEWQTLLQESPQDPLAARAFYNLGVCRFQTGAFEPAAAAFQQATQATGHAEIADAAWANLGLARFNQAASATGTGGRVQTAYQAAIDAFDKLLADYPQSNQSAAAQFYRAEALAAQGQFQPAATGYQRVLKHPQAGERLTGARLGLAAAQLELNQADQAFATLEPLLTGQPDAETTVEAYRLRGEARLAMQQPQQAAVDFGQAAQHAVDEQQGELRDRQGFAFYSAQQFDQAAQAYQQAGDRLTSGKCWLLADQAEQAIAQLQAAWQASPQADNIEAAHWLVQALVAAQRWDQVPPVAQQALQRAPDATWSGPLQLALADAWYELPEKRAEALAQYQQLAAAQPTSESGRRAAYLAAHTALQLEQPQLALTLAQQFLQQNGNDALAPEARLILVEAGTQTNQPHLAVKQLRQLLTQMPADPRSSDWALRAAGLYVAQEEWQEVVELLGARMLAMPPAIQQQAAPLLTQAYRQLDDDRSAEALLTRMLQHADAQHTPAALYQRGELRTAAGRLPAANKDFATLADRYARHTLAPYALYALAVNRKAAGEPDQAVATLKRLLQNYQQGPLGKARFLLAGILQQQGLPAQALPLLDQADAPAADLAYLRAVSLAGAGQQQSAQQQLQAWLAQYPQHPLQDQVRFELAWLLRDTQPQQAIAHFDQLAQQHPHSPLAAKARLHAGELLFAQRDFAQAAQRLQPNRAIAPGELDVRSQALHLWGWALFEQQQYEAALNAFAQQLTVAPHSPLATDAQAMRGECLLALGRHQEALQAYRKLRNQPPEDARLAALAALHAGQAAGVLGEWEESLAWLNQAARANPDAATQQQISYEQGWALFNLKRWEPARQKFAPLAAGGQSVLSARAQFMLGEVQFALRQHEPAVRSYFRVAYGFGGRDAPQPYHTWQAEALFEAARCLELLKRPQPAAKLYVELIERFPESDKAKLARNRLQAEQAR